MDDRTTQNIGANFFDRVWDIFLLNLVWLVFCLPVITIGPATAAAYDIAFRWQKKEIVPIWGTFKESFLANFKQSFLTELVGFAAVFAGLLLMRCGVMLGSAGSALTTIGFFAAAVTAAAVLLVFPIIARFELSLKDAFKNAVYLTARYTFYVLAVLLCIGIGTAFVVFLAPPLFMVMGGLVIYLNSITLNVVFNKIVKENEANEQDRL